MTERVLITGGAGFVGSHLADLLLSQGCRVDVIDDLSTGSIANIDHRRGNEKFTYVIDSIMNRPLLAEMIDRADIVVHLAAAVGVKLIVESPVRTIETNILGTETVLQLASHKKKRVVVASTSEVYGKSAKLPFHEDDDLVLGATTRGRWSYACSKAIDEFLALAYWKEKRLPTTIVRLFNTVGPRQTGRYGMVIPNFVRQALSGDAITVFGDGSQTRSFSYVSDIVDAIIKLARHPGAVGRVFNLGNPEEISIEQLAHTVKEITRSRSPIVRIPYQQAYEEGFEDMQRRCPDIRRAQELIGFSPKVKLKEIIERVAEHLRQSD